MSAHELFQHRSGFDVAGRQASPDTSMLPVGKVPLELRSIHDLSNRLLISCVGTIRVFEGLGFSSIPHQGDDSVANLNQAKDDPAPREDRVPVQLQNADQREENTERAESNSLRPRAAQRHPLLDE